MGGNGGLVGEGQRVEGWRGVGPGGARGWGTRTDPKETGIDKFHRTRRGAESVDTTHILVVSRCLDSCNSTFTVGHKSRKAV